MIGMIIIPLAWMLAERKTRFHQLLMRPML